MVSRPPIPSHRRQVRTASGFSLDDVVRPGVRLPTHEIGLLAGDSECYEMFPVSPRDLEP